MEKEKKCPECTHRIKKRTEEETKLMINRLNRIEGQVRGIRRMVENNIVRIFLYKFRRLPRH